MLVHNRYQIAGGEESVVEAERRLLESRGNVVSYLEENNDSVSGGLNQIKAAVASIYSVESKHKVAATISEFRPDIVHVHNLFPRFSSSIYDACESAGVPLVHTLHNYRVTCANALFLRDGHVCEDCLGKTIGWPGVLHGCYRGSRAGSLAVVAANAVNRARGAFEKVSAYITLTEFAKEKFIAAGLPPTRLHVKPNFMPVDPGLGSGTPRCFLYVGRLSEEKGAHILIEAWQKVTERAELVIAGMGPLENVCRAAAAKNSMIRLAGALPPAEVIRHMRSAAALIIPSTCYEGFPRVVAESFSTGTPVIASRIGAFPSLLQEGRTGLLATPADPADLAAQITRFIGMQPQYPAMRQAARNEFETKYTADRNYEMLVDIYRKAIAAKEK